MDSKDYIRIIFKRRWIIIQTFVIVGVIVVIGTSLQTPMFKATAKVSISEPNSRRLRVPFTSFDRGASMNTHFQLIKSASFLGKVIEGLDLRGKSGKPLSAAALRGRITLSDVSKTKIIRIGVDSHDPREAMLIANKIAEVFIVKNLEKTNLEITSVQKFIEEQLDILGKELDKAQGPIRKSVILMPYIRNARIAESSYSMFLRKLHDLRIAAAAQRGNVQVLDNATLPAKPYKPKKGFNIFFGGILGLVLGFAIAFLLEYFDDSFADIEEVKKILNIAILGVIPKIRGQTDKSAVKRKRKGILGKISKLIKPNDNNKFIDPLIVSAKPHSSAAEDFKILRTNIQFVRPDERVKSIVITSGIPGEGKTTIVANLAISLAQNGKNVVVVDTDLRKPMLHRFFGLSNKEGLTEVLVGAKSIEDIIQTTSVDGLKLIASGPIPPNPAELLDSKAMQKIIQKLAGEYDFILLDSPPALGLTDAAVLSSHADGVILLIDPSVISKQATLLTKQDLENAKANILGVVLSKVEEEGRGYYYSYYYYYHYHYYHQPQKKST